MSHNIAMIYCCLTGPCRSLMPLSSISWYYYIYRHDTIQHWETSKLTTTFELFVHNFAQAQIRKFACTTIKFFVHYIIYTILLISWVKRWVTDRQTDRLSTASVLFMLFKGEPYPLHVWWQFTGPPVGLKTPNVPPFNDGDWIVKPCISWQVIMMIITQSNVQCHKEILERTLNMTTLKCMCDKHKLV